jgi:hypothetical protein
MFFLFRCRLLNHDHFYYPACPKSNFNAFLTHYKTTRLMPKHIYELFISTLDQSKVHKIQNSISFPHIQGYSLRVSLFLRFMTHIINRPMKIRQIRILKRSTDLLSFYWLQISSCVILEQVSNRFEGSFIVVT